MHEYRDRIENGNFPINKSYTLNNDDVIRRDCNFSLQCNQELIIKEIEKKYNIIFSEYFSKEIFKLKKYENDGLLNFDKDYIKITTIGRYFVRHVCKIFDTFIGDDDLYEVHGP